MDKRKRGGADAMVRSFGRAFEVIEYALSRRTRLEPVDLADRFHCSRATSFRYLRALRAAGVIDHENRPARPTPARSQTLEHC